MTKTMLKIGSALGITLAIAVSCSPSPPAPPPPAPTAPTPTPPPPPPPVGNWEDTPPAEGQWVYRQDDRGSIALFGPANSEAVFMIRCSHSDRQIILSRQGAMPDARGTMDFQASHGARSYPAQNLGTGLPYATAITSATDPYLDSLVYSRGRFAVSVAGQGRLIVPNWAEFARVVEDCRH